MPSFDVSSDVDMAEVKNATLQFRKEVLTRFDFKGVNWELEEEKDKFVLSADDDFKLKTLDQMLMAKLAKRNICLKNMDHQKIETSSVGRARQEIKIKQGFEGDTAKQVVQIIKGFGIKVQAQIQEGKIRVTGKNRDDLQEVIQRLRATELPVGVDFGNFRD
jgi:cyclic-di-GMP-binding protein